MVQTVLFHCTTQDPLTQAAAFPWHGLGRHWTSFPVHGGHHTAARDGARARLSDVRHRSRRGARFPAGDAAWNARRTHHAGGSTCRRLGKIRIEPGSIEQILLNLVADVKDAMPDGGRLIVAARSEAGKATGLGLWMVGELVSRWGGEMSVRSTVGRVTTFEIRFPIAALQ